MDLWGCLETETFKRIELSHTLRPHWLFKELPKGVAKLKADLSTIKEKYSVLLIDPPWPYNKRRTDRKTRFGGGANGHYPLMTKTELFEMPVADITTDSAVLFLWSVPPKMPLAFELMEAWGFRYSTFGFTWIKLNKDGSPFFGIGYGPKSNAEHCLMGWKKGGRAVKPRTNFVSSVVFAPRMKHSQKPPEVADRIVQLYPDLAKIELFAREPRPEWDSWGRELGENEFVEGTARAWADLVL